MEDFNKFYDIWFNLSYDCILCDCLENGLSLTTETFKKLFKRDMLDIINNIN